MFAAAMIFSCPNMELSIYSTCKRISQKLLRNIVKFLELIFLELSIVPFKFLRINQEEVHVAGNEGQVTCISFKDELQLLTTHRSG
jgi:hypothetical protein